MFNRAPFGGGQQPQGRAQPPPPQYRDEEPDMRQQRRPPSGGQQQYNAGARRPVPNMRPQQSIPMRLAANKDNDIVYGNLCAVSPQDIPPGPGGTDQYIIVNEQFVFSARPKPDFPPQHISLSMFQRATASIAQNDTVQVRIYNHPSEGRNTYLASMDLEVGFAGRTTTPAPFDQDELAAFVTSQIRGQVLTPSQQFLLDHRSIALKMTVKSVQLGDLGLEKESAGSKPTSDPRHRGILTDATSINFYKDAKSDINLKASNRRPAANAIIQPDFKFEDMGIGGLDDEFQKIFRRAFASRIYPPGMIEQLGIPHVKGILLHGPPGTGKTLMARQIGKMLNAREPKVINGPEVLNKYVGQSEENVRKLFMDAEKEYKEKGEESGLHIIIFDELDAVCKQRGSGAAGGTGVGDSVVNQLLSKLDGVDQLNNILLIGMTNRMDMIDDALLRPGRLELHVEISLPDEHGRIQILNIHTAKMRANNRLGEDVDLEELALRTKNFSGAELSGLVKAASSFALTRHTKGGTSARVSEDVDKLRVNRQDFVQALDEVQSAFGVSEDTLNDCIENGIIEFGESIPQILSHSKTIVQRAREAPTTRLMSVLYHGPPGAGKTALAAKIALDSQFPFIKLVSPSDMTGMSDGQKINHLTRVFADAYKSRESIVVLDKIESIIDYNPVGPRFSQSVLGTLSNLCEKKPPKDRRLLILATTSQYTLMGQINLIDAFTEDIAVPSVESHDQLAMVLAARFSQTSDTSFAGLRQVLSGDARVRALCEATIAALREERGGKVGLGIKTILGCIESSVFHRKALEEEAPGQWGEQRLDAEQTKYLAQDLAQKSLRYMPASSEI